MRRRFVVLDRDGTLIESHEYLADAERVALLPAVPEALARLRELGLGLVVVTNQSAVARGRLDLRGLEAIHRRLENLLGAEGVSVDGIYFCPHHPDEGCSCRKPATGLLERAAQELEFAPEECFVVGDNVCDVELGEAVGAVTLLVTTGHGGRVLEEGGVAPDHVVSGLGEAASVIRDILCGERTAR